MVLGEQVGELVRGDAEGDDERQVEQQLERCRHPVLLVGVPTRHPANPVLDRRRSLLRLAHVVRPFTATFHRMAGG